MKRFVRVLSLFFALTLLMGSLAIPAQAGTTSYLTLNVGDSQYLYLNSSKAVTAAFWSSTNSESVRIESQGTTSCKIKVVGPSTRTVLIHCEYYYTELFNGYMYSRSDYKDFEITVKGSGGGGGGGGTESSFDCYLNIYPSNKVTLDLAKPENVQTPSLSLVGYTPEYFRYSVVTSLPNSIAISCPTGLFYSANTGFTEIEVSVSDVFAARGEVPFMGTKSITISAYGNNIGKTAVYLTGKALSITVTCSHIVPEDADKTPPTCTEDGLLKSFHCSACKRDVTVNETIPKKGHSFSDWTVSKAATPYEEGTEIRVCTECGEQESRPLEKLPYPWVKENGNWYYELNGKRVTGWIQDQGRWFYLDATGAMQTGWLKNGGYWYYLGTEGVMRTGWVNVGFNRYYLNKSGVMQTGWVKVGSSWYYLNASGVLQTGWLKLGTVWYYLAPDGAMATGWRTIGKNTYYFTDSGAMVSGICKINNTSYCFAPGGALQAGWLNLNGKWYYANATGIAQTGWVKVGSNWYYMDANGVMQTGWVKVGGYWYYLSNSGAMVTGTQTINGKSYTFNANGVLLG